MQRQKDPPPAGDAGTQVLRSRPGRRSAPRGRRAPRQERSRETVDVILQAAADVFGKLGYAGATTNKIAERAGYSVGSLYQYFSSKDDILLVLLERHQREVHAVVEVARGKLADSSIPLEEGLRCLLEGLLDVHARDPSLSRVLAHGIDRAEGSRAGETGEGDRYVEEVMAILDRRPEVQVENARSAALVVVQTVELLIRWLVHEAPPSVDFDAFVDELLTMLLRYLTHCPPQKK
jgi:AcrR family transcriptional regulator